MQETRYVAFCDRCWHCLAEEVYQALEAASKNGLEVTCPHCGTDGWHFEPMPQPDEAAKA